MHDLSIITTLAGGLGAALVLGFLALRLGLSPIVGYLVAGIAVGPFTPGYVANRAVADQFADIGVVLLMFGIGLRFHLHELFAVWRVAVPGALIQSTLSTAILALLLRFFGWEWTPGIVLGLAISVSSTVVMSRVLAERQDLHTPIGHIAIGWTVVEDLITVIIILLLPILILNSGGQGSGVMAALGLAAIKMIVLVGIVVVLGRWVLPWALERIAVTRSRELFTLAVLVLALGIAVGAASVFGVSMALGAFLAGLAVGRSDFASRAASDAMPMRDAFAVLFFISVGMLFDPASLIHSPGLIAVVLAAVLLGKPLIAWLAIRLLGRPATTAIPVAAALAQVGEFSFILGVLARQLGVLGDAGWNALVAAAIISIAFNPILYRWSRRLSGAGAMPSTVPLPGEPLPVDPKRCILVGYGPVGRSIHGILTTRGIAITVVELNLLTVRRLRREGIQVLYGDVLRPGTLTEAGIDTAGSLILSADIEDAAEVIRQALQGNRGLRVLARCTHLRDAAALRRAGATVVAVGEAEVAVALVEAVMASEEASPTALAAQRLEVREQLYGPLAQSPQR